jgi:hypothetical protein
MFIRIINNRLLNLQFRLLNCKSILYLNEFNSIYKELSFVSSLNYFILFEFL